MLNYWNIRSLILFMLTSLLFVSCGTNETEKAGGEDPENLSFKEKNDYPRNQLQQDNAQAEKQFGAYTYIIEPEDIVVPVVEGEQDVNKQQQSPKAIKTRSRETDIPEKVPAEEIDQLNTKTDEIPSLELNMKAVIEDLEMNRPPIYRKACLDAEYPEKCSADQVSDFIKENLEFPEDAVMEDHDGLEVATFTITKEGKLENLKVKTKDRPCYDCAEAVMNVILSMPNDWLPALRDGKPVQSQVTLPVKMKTEEN